MKYVRTKILATACCGFMIAVIIIAWANPATGYELDIYKSTPIFTWIFLALAISGGAYIILHQVITKGYETSRMWLLGLLVLVLSRFALLYIPYIRGYVTWNGDNLTHWGYLRDIINTGHLGPENYYPITHSFLSQTIIVSDMPIQYATNLSTAFLSVLFILAVYLLATAVLPRRGQQLLATAIAGMVMVEGTYNVFLMPNGWSILMLPLLFYFYFKRQSSSAYTFLFVLLLIMYPLFHPLSGLMIVVALLALLVFRIVINLVRKKKDNIKSPINPKSILVPLMLELAVLITWILSFNVFKPNLRQMWEQITSGGPDIFGGMGDTLSKINMNGLDVLLLYAKLYGMQTILIILSLIGLISLIRQLKKTGNKQSLLPYLGIGIVFLLFGSLYVLYYLGVPGLQSIGAERLLYYTMLFTPILAALTLYKISQVYRFKYLVSVILLFVLGMSSVLSSADLYHAPYNVRPNAAITQHDMDGMAWFFNKKDIGIRCAEIMSPVYRYADGILGAVEAEKRQDIIKYRTVQFADHFGYEEYNSVGEQYSQDLYAAITKKDRIIYSTVWKDVGRFIDDDFNRLEADSTVNRLYENGELTMYYVSTIQSE